MILAIYNGVTPFSSLFIMSRGGNSEYTKIVSDMIELGCYLLRIGIVYFGFKWGKDIEIEEHYRTFFKAIIASWLGSVVFSAIGWLLVQEVIWNSIFQLMVTQSILSGYTTGMMVFSGVVLAGLWTNKYRFEREWNRPILKYVLIITGLRFVYETVRTYLWADYFKHNMSALTTFSWTTAVALWCVNWWYLFKLFGVGKKVNLIEDYKTILFTLWATRIVSNMISEIFLSLIYERTVLKSMIEIVFRMIQSSVSSFGVGFAVLCLGYYHRRYLTENGTNALSS